MKSDKPEKWEIDKIVDLVKWFEDNYNPTDTGINGNPKAAELVMRGMKGIVLIRIMYEKKA